MPGPPSTAEHGSPARYRRGCRCADCRTAHAADKQKATLEKLYGAGAPMGPTVRRKILTRLRQGLTVVQAAREVGVTHQAVYGACKAIPEFGEQVDNLTRTEN